MGVPTAPQAFLLVSGARRTAAFELRLGEPLVLGRRFPATTFDDATLSRQHARLCRREDGVWLEDLNSRNGCWVNGERVSRTRIRATDQVRLGEVTLTLVVQCASEARSGEVVALDPAVVSAHVLARRVASVDVPVLIQGETGVGKEVVAGLVHREGSRRAGPLKEVNCGAVPKELMESELFGHERGAFTGAQQRRAGAFEQAAGGTLFLDEIGELDPAAQAALLRVVETKRITRVGGTQEVPVDVRIVAATHRDLQAMAEAGTFCRDLLHRLDTVRITLPPLRERVAEIGPLVAAFLPELAKKWRSEVRGVSPTTLARLEMHRWPGNIRELRNVLERCLLVCDGTVIEPEHLPEEFHVPGGADRDTMATVADVRETLPVPGSELSLRDRVREYEHTLIEQALERCDGNRTLAAKELGLPLRTLHHKLSQQVPRD